MMRGGWTEGFCDDGENPTSLVLKELVTMIAHCLVLIQKISWLGTDQAVGAIICYGHL
jgi:hypothetical protein